MRTKHNILHECYDKRVETIRNVISRSLEGIILKIIIFSIFLKETRFEMRDVLDPAPGVECFRLANPPPFLAALNLAALEMFEEVIFFIDFLLQRQSHTNALYNNFYYTYI